MSDRTKISWSDATWNPVTGCTKVSPGCKNCYAERFSERFRGVPGHAFERGFDLRLWPERLKQPMRWRRPRRIFVNSMSDLFHEDVPEEFIDQVFASMICAPQHVFQVLTKRPGRMRSWSVRAELEEDLDRIRLGIRLWPATHVWLGASAEDQKRLEERAPLVATTPSGVRFLSCEPLLGPLDLDGFLGDGGVNWVIVGGESGPRFRPMLPVWAASIAVQCERAGVPVFVKQASGARPGKQGDLPDWLWAKKEFPRSPTVEEPPAAPANS